MNGCRSLLKLVRSVRIAQKKKKKKVNASKKMEASAIRDYKARCKCFLALSGFC